MLIVCRTLYFCTFIDMVKIVDARKVVINNQKGLSSHVEQHRFHRQDDGGDDGLPSLTLLVF